MRVLVTTTGCAGHVLPVLPFARATDRAGHDVCVAGPRSAGAIVREAGLAFCGWSDPPQAAVAELLAEAARLTPAAGHAAMVAEGFGRVATQAALAEVLQLVGAWWPDVVVRESQEFAGYLAAERHRIAHARIALGLALGERETIALAAAALQDLRAELGLPPDPGGERLAGSPCLSLVPGLLEHPDAPDSGVTYRFREPVGAQGGLPDWWPGVAGPLVYVTFGSVAARLGYFPDLYRRVCVALAGLPARVLVTVGDADPSALGPLPANVHAERWCDQQRVLAQAAAVVCHGGFGTVLGALAHGVPLVVVPLFAGDQWHDAARVEAIGAGIARQETRATMFAPPGDEPIARLPGAVRRALDCERRAARQAADAIRALPDIAAAAQLLGEIAQPPTSRRADRN